VIHRLLIITAFTGFIIASLTGFATAKEPPSPQVGNNTYTTLNYVQIDFQVKAAQMRMGAKLNKAVAPVRPKSTPLATRPTVTTTTTTAPPIQSRLATPAQVAAWSMTATCETGGDWSMQGPIYSGGLGMLNATWAAYGGTQFASNAGLATPQQQVTVAMRIQSNPPDPGYCAGSW
jgi:hypothetical protein